MKSVGRKRHLVTKMSLTSNDSGDMKENRPGSFFSGLRNRMLMPRFINGLVKSITCSRM